MSLQTIADIRAASLAAPRRRQIALLFLAALTAVTVLTWQHTNVRTGTLGTNTALSLRRIASPSVAPAKPSVFEQELALSSKELLHRWDPIVEKAAKRFGVPANWIRAVMNTETGGRTALEGGPITSPMGAMGLMQVMPGTYEEMRQQYGLGADAYNPHDNIFAGAAYLSWLRSKFGNPGMFAAYNGGPGKYIDHQTGNAALPAETIAYVGRVATFLGTRKTDRVMEILDGGKKGESVALTGPDGAPLVVDAAKVHAVRAPLPGEYAEGVNAVLRVGRKNQGVHEAPIVVAALVRKHGGVV